MVMSEKHSIAARKRMKSLTEKELSERMSIVRRNGWAKKSKAVKKANAQRLVAARKSKVK